MKVSFSFFSAFKAGTGFGLGFFLGGFAACAVLHIAAVIIRWIGGM